MSNTKHINTHHKNEEHGSVGSYVTGFVLSLIFTAIPYYFVVNNSFPSTTLIPVILGFGVIQMLIQIFFFLHLGRGPKPFYNIVFFISTVSLILVVVFGSIFIMDHLHYNMAPSDVTKKLAQGEGIDQVGGEKTGACQDLGSNHKVVIANDMVTTPHIYAKLCDTITFINEDQTARNITFGTHPEHGPYAGNDEISVTKSRSNSVTLNQTGDYQFHDHEDPRITGGFTVTE